MPRSCNSTAGKALPFGNFAALQGFSRHRQFNSSISRHLMNDAGTRDIGQKIANCALTLKADVLIHPELPPETNLKGARLCNTRLCPFCEWRRTRVWRARLYEGLTALYKDEPKLKGIFLTLTVRNVPLRHLGEELDFMNKGWKRLTKRAFWPSNYWFRRTEVTVGSSSPDGEVMAHPHFHVLLLVKPSYFSTGYIKQTEWQKQWMDAARLDYSPVVDVRTAKQKPGPEASLEENAKGAVMEAAKYAAKATDLIELGDSVSELHWQLRNRRLYALSSSLRKYIKAGDVSPDEMLDNEAKPLPLGTDRIEVIAQWFEDTSEYLITDVTSQ